MRRVYAVVEGQCEQRFLKQVVAPSWHDRGLQLEAMLVRRGGGGRGGGSRWEPWADNIQRLLKQHAKPEVQVTMLLDLYRVPINIPGWSEAAPGRGPERADRIVEAVRTAIPDRRFVPYLQVHEFETYLFSDLEALRLVAADVIDDQSFKRLLGDVAHLEPEAVDDGPETHPATRIARCIRGFSKTQHGFAALEKTGLPTIRARCPRFDGWLRALENDTP